MNGLSSDSFSIEIGVPQGSPLLFLIYINDLEIGIKSEIKFFEDDTMIDSVAINPLRTASDLNHDLTTISKWTHQWKIAFNLEPNKHAVELLFSHKFKTFYHPLTSFNGIEVNKATRE